MLEIYVKYFGKGEKLLNMSNFFSYPQIFCYLLFDFQVKTGTKISPRDKRLFEITEVEITRADCTCNACTNSSSVKNLEYLWNYWNNTHLVEDSFMLLLLVNKDALSQ